MSEKDTIRSIEIDRLRTAIVKAQDLQSALDDIDLSDHFYPDELDIRRLIEGMERLLRRFELIRMDP